MSRLGLGILARPNALPPQYASMIMWMDPRSGLTKTGAVVDQWASRVGSAVFAGSGGVTDGGGYLLFDGVDDYLSRTADAHSHPGGQAQCTLTGWVRQFAIAAPIQCAISTAGSVGCSLAADNTRRIYSVESRAALLPAGAPPVGSWQFRAFSYSAVAITAYEGATPAAVAVVSTAAGAGSVIGVSGQQSRIGSFDTTFPRHFSGRIGHLGLWTTALTLAELQAFAALTVPP